MTGMPTPGADQPAPPAAFRLFYVFLPETSILRRVRFQIVFLSRLLSEIGHEAIMYGSLVAVAAGGSVFEAALVGMAALVPAAALGLYAGTVSDTLPKRVALYLASPASTYVTGVVIPVDGGISTAQGSSVMG